jgi:hypothetical protein
MALVEGEPSLELEAFARRLAQGFRGPPPERPPTGFGARQRWTLTRLGWAPEPGRPLLLVVRSQFIDAEALAAMEAEPPADAIALTPGADGLVDGLTAEDAMAFYAVLEGPTPWRSLRVLPVPPPFDTLGAPVLLGEVEARVEAGIARALERAERGEVSPEALAPLAQMCEATLAGLAPESQVRGRTRARLARLARSLVGGGTV